MSSQFPTVIEEIIKEYEEGTFRLTKPELSLYYQYGDMNYEIKSHIINLPVTPGVWTVRWAPAVYLPQGSYRMLVLYRSDADLSKLPAAVEVKSALIGENKLFVSDGGGLLLCSGDKPLLLMDTWHIDKIAFEGKIYSSPGVIAIPAYRNGIEESSVHTYIQSALIRKADQIIDSSGEYTFVFPFRDEVGEVRGIQVAPFSSENYKRYLPSRSPPSPIPYIIIRGRNRPIEEYRPSGKGKPFLVDSRELAPDLASLPLLAEKIVLAYTDFPRLWREDANMRMIYERLMRARDEIKEGEEETEENKKRFIDIAANLIALPQTEIRYELDTKELTQDKKLVNWAYNNILTYNYDMTFPQFTSLLRRQGRLSYDDIKNFLSKFPVKPQQPWNRGSKKVKELASFLPSRHFVSVLDVGCNDAVITTAIRQEYKLRKEDTYCIDVKTVRSSEVSVLTYTGGNKIPLPDDSIDVILMLEVLHHVTPDRLPTLVEEVYRVLKPKGTLVIAEHDALPDKGFSQGMDFIHWIYDIVNKEGEISSYYSHYMSMDEVNTLLTGVGFIAGKKEARRSDAQRRYYASYHK